MGIIYDWGNFKLNKQRYGALSVSTRKHNHCHNHVKIFHFNDEFQEKRYDSMRIVKEFADAGFDDYFSIEWEGWKNPTLEGVYKSVNALMYAITEGKHELNQNFDYDSLLNIFL